MSNTLAISGVTAMLQHNLGIAYSSADPPFASLPTITCLAPDQVQGQLGGAAGDENQVNLFLHQVTHNLGWRNADLPSLGADGKNRLKNPPLALDLHYLLTVYGSDNWQAEALLGCALLALHDNPVLSRADIAAAFTSMGATPPPNTGQLAQHLSGSGLADQIEMIKITPSTLGREEVAWLWTALKADYRPTYPFQVTVVLMQSQRAVSLGLPVLQRNLRANAIQPAEILKFKPGDDVGAVPGDTVVATGEFLAGVTQVALRSEKFGALPLIPAAHATSASFSFVLNQIPPIAAGVYSLAGEICDSAGSVLQSTNVARIALAPSLPTQAAAVTVTPAGIEVGVSSISPAISERQEAWLALSALGPIAAANPYFSVSAPLAKPISGSATTCAFLFPSSLPLGKTLLARLIVDGVPSPVDVDWTQHPPQFVGPTVTT